MNNNERVVMPIPFKEPIVYYFDKISDCMIFKFAVTSNEDLLGFLYLEIPDSYKQIKKFKLEDWFPVQKVQTEGVHVFKDDNFMVQLKIEYNASSKVVKT